jgi:Uma2 family endonuclease
LFSENAAKRSNQCWNGADLVMEVVSEDDPERDWVTKREEYAQAGIREYWIVDPMQRVIQVLKLHGNAYIVHGEFQRGQRARSNLLPGFEVSVDAALSPPDASVPTADPTSGK